MTNVVCLFPQQQPATQPSTKKRHQQASRQSPAGTAFPPYLAQRNGVFYFKRKVPADLVQGFGNHSQVWKSLETTDFIHACRALAKESAAFELRVATVRLRMLNDGIAVQPTLNVIALREDMIPTLLLRYYIHMLEREEKELRSMRPICMADMGQRKADADAALKYYQLAQSCEKYEAVEETASQILAGEALSAPSGSAMRELLCKELLATEISILKEQRARLEGNKQSTPQSPIPVRLQPTLNDYLNVWLKAKIRPTKTRDTVSHMFRLWNELMGANPASSITRGDVKAFRDMLLGRQLSTETIKNRLGLMRAVVNAYRDENDIKEGRNPFEDIEVPDNGQRLRVEKDRRAFEMWELNQIYRSPVFTEHKLPSGQAGEAAYWLPLMGPFVGARIEELAQMRLVDIEIINGVWTLRICNLDPKTQKLKTKNSFRRVPIHDELIKLGFLRYVCELKRGGAERLFPTLQNNNKYGIWSNAVGKWFGRLLGTQGLTTAQLDYHSFRYVFKQRMTQCRVIPEVRDALTGHWLGKESAGRVYSKGAQCQYDFVMLCDAIKSLRYDELDLSHLHVDDPWDNVDAKLFYR